MNWDLNQLFQIPEYEPAKGFDFRGNVKPFFYHCGTWRERKVKAFAWVGIPELKDGEKCPGIVLVHGGGGTAFPDWVRLWNSRGYAAIAMDTCGGVPCWNESPYSRNPWPRHEFSGPAGWGNFVAADLPPEEQWPYQAVAAVVAGHSLLRSMPHVDADRIGITGISWGGVLTSMAAGVDSRFVFAAPVYGCGFLNLSNFGEYEQVKDDPAKPQRWSELWDPSIFLRQAVMPFLWVNGTNDFAFPLDTTVKSSHAIKGKSNFALRVRMIHGHGGAGENPEEIHNFANLITGHGVSLPPPEFSPLPTTEGRAAMSFRSSWVPDRAELNYTVDTGAWKERFWNTVPAELENDRISAPLPADATAWYFNLYSENALTFSSEPTV